MLARRVHLGLILCAVGLHRWVKRRATTYGLTDADGRYVLCVRCGQPMLPKR